MVQRTQCALCIWEPGFHSPALHEHCKKRSSNTVLAALLSVPPNLRHIWDHESSNSVRRGLNLKPWDKIPLLPIGKILSLSVSLKGLGHVQRCSRAYSWLELQGILLVGLRDPNEFNASKVSTLIIVQRWGEQVTSFEHERLEARLYMEFQMTPLIIVCEW